MAGCIVFDLDRYRIFLISVVIANSLLFVTDSSADCIEDAAAHHHVNPTLARAIASVESRFSPITYHRNANGSEDIGLMQINSSWLLTFSRFGISRTALFDGCVNAYVGTWILSQNISRLGLTWNAVGAYNAMSPGKRVQYARRVYAELFKFTPGATTTQLVTPVTAAPASPNNPASGLSVAETE